MPFIEKIQKWISDFFRQPFQKLSSLLFCAILPPSSLSRLRAFCRKNCFSQAHNFPPKNGLQIWSSLLNSSLLPSFAHTDKRLEEWREWEEWIPREFEGQLKGQNFPNHPKWHFLPFPSILGWYFLNRNHKKRLNNQKPTRMVAHFLLIGNSQFRKLMKLKAEIRFLLSKSK